MTKSASKDKAHSQGSKASEKTREQLLEAARDLFSQRGFYGVSVKEICDQAKCNISLISYHYGGKEGLYRSCVEPLAAAEADAALKDITDPNSYEDFRQQLQLIAENMLFRATQDFRLVKIIGREMESDDPIIMDVFEKTYHQVFLRLNEIIVKSIEKKWLRSDIFPPVATMMFIGTLMHVMRVEGLRKRFFNRTITDDTYRKLVASQVVALFTNGIIA